MNQIRSKTLLALTAAAITSGSFYLAPAHAQQRELQSGLNYTTMGRKAKPAEAKTEEASSPAKPTDLPRASRGKATLPPVNATVNKDQKPQAQETDEATRIWNKYKELATGTAAKDEENKDEKKSAKAPEAPTPPTVDNPQLQGAGKTAAAPQQNAFGAILEEWKNTKEDRRDMRSMTFNKQETEQAPKENTEEQVAEKDTANAPDEAKNADAKDKE